MASKRASPRKRAAQPLKDKGKAGSGKRMIFRSGGGRKTLKTWRSIDQPTRKKLREQVRTSGGLPGVAPGDLTAWVKADRKLRTERGKNPTTGQPARTTRELRPGTTRRTPRESQRRTAPTVGERRRTGGRSSSSGSTRTAASSPTGSNAPRYDPLSSANVGSTTGTTATRKQLTAKGANVRRSQQAVRRALGG